jgi:multidrug efflux pump subunit AcrB
MGKLGRHFVLDQDRLRLIGLSSNDAEQQIQFLTTGVTVTQVREDIRAVDVMARTSGPTAKNENVSTSSQLAIELTTN